MVVVKQVCALAPIHPTEGRRRQVPAAIDPVARRRREGGFRADLFFRLNGFPITLPPLRERREDILPLAAHFIRKICAREGKAIAGMTDRAQEALLAYRWPGNSASLRMSLSAASSSQNPSQLD